MFLKAVTKLSLKVALKERPSGEKVKACIGFTCNSLKIAVKHLIQNCFFTVGNITLKHDTCIPIEVNPVLRF